MNDQATVVPQRRNARLAAGERFRVLLKEARSTFGADATALLELRGDFLMPIAVDGLHEETLGRCFRIDEQPVLRRIMQNRDPVRFVDCSEPSPHDGLLKGLDDNVGVHDCMGVPLFVDDLRWGALTMDAARPGAFDPVDAVQLRMFVMGMEKAIRDCMPDSPHWRSGQRRVSLECKSLPRRHELIGASTPMMRLWDELEVAVEVGRPALVLGETGVGKELVTQWLHCHSVRSNKPFVIVNCAALPAELAESELFGHDRGAFTGASERRVGKFEQANGGTLVLDEIGELPASIQPKLLRALQSGEIQRPGSDRHHQVDVWVISVSNRNLSAMVHAGTFRADLYYRLCGVRVTVAPLRERGDDVLMLAGLFLEDAQSRLGTPDLRLTRACRASLLAHDWPGNIRELENVIAHASARAMVDQGRDRRWIRVGVEHLSLVQLTGTPSPRGLFADEVDAGATGMSLRAATDEFQRRWIRQAMERSNHSVTVGARAAGMDPSNFGRLLSRLGLR